MAPCTRWSRRSSLASVRRPEGGGDRAKSSGGRATRPEVGYHVDGPFQLQMSGGLRRRIWIQKNTPWRWSWTLPRGRFGSETPVGGRHVPFWGDGIPIWGMVKPSSEIGSGFWGLSWIGKYLFRLVLWFSFPVFKRGQMVARMMLLSSVFAGSRALRTADSRLRSGSVGLPALDKALG